MNARSIRRIAERMRASMELTLRWAERSKKYFEEHKQEVPWTRVGTAALGCQGERSSPVCRERR